MSLRLSSAVRTVLRTRLAAAPAARAIHASAVRSDIYKNADAETFREWVNNKDDRVVLVDFYANWCGPCRMLSPVLDRIAQDRATRTGSGKEIDLVTVDTDVEHGLAQEFQIASLPTVIAFRDGKNVSQIMGALPEPSVRQWLKSL